MSQLKSAVGEDPRDGLVVGGEGREGDEGAGHGLEERLVVFQGEGNDDSNATGNRDIMVLTFVRVDDYVVTDDRRDREPFIPGNMTNCFRRISYL